MAKNANQFNPFQWPCFLLNKPNQHYVCKARAVMTLQGLAQHGQQYPCDLGWCLLQQSVLELSAKGFVAHASYVGCCHRVLLGPSAAQTCAAEDSGQTNEDGLQSHSNSSPFTQETSQATAKPFQLNPVVITDPTNKRLNTASQALLHLCAQLPYGPETANQWIYERLYQLLTEEHPELTALRAEVAGLRQRLDVAEGKLEKARQRQDKKKQVKKHLAVSMKRCMMDYLRPQACWESLASYVRCCHRSGNGLFIARMAPLGQHSEIQPTIITVPEEPKLFKLKTKHRANELGPCLVNAEVNLGCLKALVRLCKFLLKRSNILCLRMRELQRIWAQFFVGSSNGSAINPPSMTAPAELLLQGSSVSKAKSTSLSSSVLTPRHCSLDPGVFLAPPYKGAKAKVALDYKQWTLHAGTLQVNNQATYS
ncbi:hypothetical protein IE81DRAFT_331494 [Ceraceosorus guamensis]|uniref:Uncharacterized protein n=1 Tax=Ceraceosorus guamensis TaxID=1522189 RepID=A0A316VSS4_9BASI|nr:hypothetical protein IE81DRAFT_331494 [Ceraceosorus guamensis]PWN40637.1 hypothetical protein IE81DRAFT_331494 [Ceraceosorus guamensis]